MNSQSDACFHVTTCAEFTSDNLLVALCKCLVLVLFLTLEIMGSGCCLYCFYILCIMVSSSTPGRSGKGFFPKKFGAWLPAQKAVPSGSVGSEPRLEELRQAWDFEGRSLQGQPETSERVSGQRLLHSTDQNLPPHGHSGVLWRLLGCHT